MNKVNIAILGATGVVGQAMVEILESRNFPVGELYLLARESSVGETLVYKNKNVDVTLAEDFDFSKVDIALFSAGSEASAIYAPKAASCGCIVIDNTSHFRYEDDIPLIIPEVNPQKIIDVSKRNIIANPNCSTIQMLVALKPIIDTVGIKKINVVTYQSVAGSGKAAISELIKQCGELLNGRPATYEVYPEQIAFNVIPHIDDFLDNGYSREEMKMVWETKKILGDDTISVNPTTARVPVIYGHAEAIHLETKAPLSAELAKQLLDKAMGVELVDNLQENEYPTQLRHGAGTDEVFVGRVRNDLDNDCGLNLWVVADNVRKGAALNSIQIAELLVSEGLVKTH